MKDTLKEKIFEEGRLADELVRTQGYELISEKINNKKELMLKEALNSKTIDELRYNRGFLDGLDFFGITIQQLTARRDAQKKRINN